MTVNYLQPMFILNFSSSWPQNVYAQFYYAIREIGNNEILFQVFAYLLVLTLPVMLQGTFRPISMQSWQLHI
jgi:hypothetical protein